MLKSESSRFGAFMLTIAVIGFGGLAYWSYTKGELRTFLIIFGLVLFAYVFLLVGFAWIARGE